MIYDVDTTNVRATFKIRLMPEQFLFIFRRRRRRLI